MRFILLAGLRQLAVGTATTDAVTVTRSSCAAGRGGGALLVAWSGRHSGGGPSAASVLVPENILGFIDFYVYFKHADWLGSYSF